MVLNIRLEALHKMILGILFVFMAVGTSAGFGGGWSNDPGKVRLQDVQVLTLKDGKMTTGKRSSPVSQLNCVGGSAQGKFRPQVVQCKNMGWDGQDVQVCLWC